MSNRKSLNKSGIKVISGKKTLTQEIKRSIFALLFTLIFIIIIVSITFLLNNASSYQKGYSLISEQQKQDLLIDQKNFLVDKINQIKSLRNIEQNPITKSMLPPENIIYLNK